MTCETSREMLEALVDGELATDTQTELLHHLETCAECTARRDELRAMSEMMKDTALFYRAPAGLDTRIRKALQPEAIPWRMVAIAASVLFVISLAANFALLRKMIFRDDLIADEVVSSHVRSLLGTHLVDVQSGNQHVVKPWFNGKIDYSPAVEDFAARGFPLAGARIEYIGGRRVAALVYFRHQHVINAFVWPSERELAAETMVRSGYNVIHWSKKGATWWIVSDLNVAELNEFERLLQ